MEETLEQPQENIQPAPISPTPTFSSSEIPPAKGKKTAGLLFIILALVLILAGVLFFLGRKGNKQSTEASPAPGDLVVQENIPTEESPTPSPQSSIDKEQIAIEIQNGTGLAKEASYLSDKLKLLGYKKITSGNAQTQNYSVTTVTFSSSLSSVVVNEITSELEKIYQEVKTTKSSSLSVDARIITGLRKGVTPKPSLSATPTSSTSPSPTAEPSLTPTPTATPL